MDSQKGCGLSCAVLSLLSETSPLIGQHSAVQPKAMGLHPLPYGDDDIKSSDKILWGLTPWILSKVVVLAVQY